MKFAPSRFIGYVNNNFAKHGIGRRNGTVTNDKISAIFNHRPIEDERLDDAYRKFCIELGFQPRDAGSFGVSRKFWIPVRIADGLNESEQDRILLDLKLIRANLETPETEKEQLVLARVGQGEFRTRLIEKWRRCCLTDCAIRPVLRASHIKPWRSSTNEERLDVYNGLLLSANMDALFDGGLISISDCGDILRRPGISEDVLRALGCDPDRQVAVEERHAPYLAHHRNYIFRQ